MSAPMGFGPDSLVLVEIDGVLYTDHFKNMTAPAPVRLSRWQRIVRRLTPKRSRKPLHPPTPVERALALTSEANRLIKRLTR